MHSSVHRRTRPATVTSALLGVLAALLAVLLPLPLAGTAEAAVGAAPTVALSTVPGGSAGVGEPVTLVATVGPATTTGTVTFSDSLTVLANNVPVVNGQASVVVSSLASGPHSLDALLRAPQGLADSGWVPFQVQNTPWVSLTASSVAAFSGQSVTLTAQVSPGRTGWVFFYDGAHYLNGLPLVNGTASMTVSNLTAGAHSLTASYNCSDCADRGLSVPLVVTVTRVLVTASVVTPGPTSYGTPITVGAQVSPSTVSGRFYLFDRATQVAGPVTVRDGQGSFTVTTLPAGTHQLSTRWVSDLVTASAQSALVPASVIRRQPSITVTAQPATATERYENPDLEWVLLTATVHPDPGGTLYVFGGPCYGADNSSCVRSEPYGLHGVLLDGERSFKDWNKPGTSYNYKFVFVPDDKVNYSSSESAWFRVDAPKH